MIIALSNLKEVKRNLRSLKLNSLRNESMTGIASQSPSYHTDFPILSDKGSILKRFSAHECFLSCSPYNSKYIIQKPLLVHTSRMMKSLGCTSIITQNQRISVQEKTDLKVEAGRIADCNRLPALSERPYIMGIDPGITGAIAIIDTRNIPKLVTVFDMPLEKNSQGRNRIDVMSLGFKVECFSSLVKVALIEEVGQVGTKADPFSSFVFGFATGVVHGVLATCLIPIESVRPSTWKLNMGLSSNKDESIQKAIKHFPESEEFLTRKKDHGRAEAILLAWLAYKSLRKK